MKRNNIKWQFQFPRNEFVDTMKNGKLAAQIENCPSWFMPESESWTDICLEAFCRHVRKLARYYKAKTVSVKILKSGEYGQCVLFRRCYLFKAKYMEQTDQSRNNVYYFYYKHYTTNEGDKLCIHTEIIREKDLFPDDYLKCPDESLSTL